MNRRLAWLVFLVLAATSLALIACAPAAPEPAAEEPAAEEPAAEEPAAEEPAEAVTITLWHAYQTGSAEESTLATLVENARAEFPQYTIEVLQIPFDQVFNKWETEVAAGGGPTMFVAPNDSLGNEARASLLAPLDMYLEGKLDGVNENGIEGMKVDGVLYGVPESAKAVALYYNKSLVETPPATTDELLAAVEGGAPMTFFIGAYHMFGWPAAFGGQLLDQDGRCVADQGGWVEAMDYLLALKEAGATFTADYGQAEGPFRNGETAFFVNGPWALADYKQDLGDDLGVALMPAGPGGPAGPLNGIDGYYVNPNISESEIAAAVEVALFLTSGESAQIYTDSAGHVPIRDSVSAADPLVATFAEASAQGFPRPQSTFFANYWTPFGDMFTKVIEGASTPEEAVDEACSAMNTANGF